MLSDEQGTNPYLLEDFWQSFKQSFRGASSVAAQSIEELRKTPRGWFLGVVYSRKAFWVFLGFLSRAWFQSCSVFQGGEQPQIIICFLAATAAQQQHPRKEVILVVLRVFLHLPCASWGAICLITSCTHLWLSIIKWLSIFRCISCVSTYISGLHYYMLFQCYFITSGLLYHLHIFGWSFC